MKKTVITLMLCAAINAVAQNPSIIFPAGSPRQNITLAQTQTSDSANVAAPVLRRVSAHVANIISPQRYAVITELPVVYEIEPTIHADSVILFVRHSHTVVDTIGVFTSPPYRGVWHPEDISDQDQIHLQFGYTIFSGDTLITVSPPMPHRHMLTVNMPHRKEKTYRAKQLAFIAFDVDGDIAKWDAIPAEAIGDNAYFKLMWTTARLHFMVNVRDSSVTPGDFIELHVDMHRDRADFSGINHRSIRYSPLSGSRAFVVDLKEDDFIYADSVNAFIAEENEWKAVVTDSGYIIEAAIPFVALADVTSAPSVIGLDVSIMNIDRTSAGVVWSYASWSGSTQYFRYSPRVWGTVKMGHATLALQTVFMAVVFLTCAAFIFFIVQNIFSEHRKNRHDPIDNDNYSQTTDLTIDAIEDNLIDKNFSLAKSAQRLGKTESEIEASLQKDMDITFEQLLLFRRIKRSQKLMRDESLTIEQIADKCGFADVETYRTAFKAQMRFDPEVSRDALLNSIREDERDRLEDEEE